MQPLCQHTQQWQGPSWDPLTCPTVSHWAVGHTAAAGNILAKLPWRTWVLCSPCRPLLSLGCEWHRAGSQGHQGCLTRREVSHGEGFAWAAHRTQQVPSFWRKSLLWRTDTTCLFTLDGICWHFLCAKALISEQSREGRYRALGDSEMANTSAVLHPGTGLSMGSPMGANPRGQQLRGLSPLSATRNKNKWQGIKMFCHGGVGEEDKLS